MFAMVLNIHAPSEHW